MAPGAQLGNIIVVAAFRIISFLILPVKGEVKKKNVGTCVQTVRKKRYS